jgi:hypothetical protein
VNAAEHFHRQGARQLGARDLDTGKLAVMAHTKFAEAELAQTLFAALDLAEHFPVHGAAIFDARAQAWCRGTVPECVSGHPGECADLLFRQARISKRSQDMVFLRCPLPGTEIAPVIGVHAVGDRGESEFGAQRLHALKQLGLTVEAAIGIISPVFRFIEFAGFDHAQRHNERLGESACLFHIPAGKTGRIRQYGEHAVAENAVRGGGKKGGIDPPRIGNHDAAKLAKTVLEKTQLQLRRLLRNFERCHGPDYTPRRLFLPPPVRGPRVEAGKISARRKVYSGRGKKIRRISKGKVILMSKWICGVALLLAMIASPLRMPAQSDTVLKPADTEKLLPAAVYYKAQSAPTQLRNSGGVKFSDGYYLLATLVDTSGYSSDVAAKYQAYFITEVPVKAGGENLAAGIYGVGFIANDKFVVTDVGAHDVMTVSSSTDQEMKRPVPLQVTPDPAGGFRLYEGRRFVTFSR